MVIKGKTQIADIIYELFSSPFCTLSNIVYTSATNPFFRVDHQPREGRYDLHLSHANYDRDNGRFECRIKEDGTGVELYTLTVAVTVLLPPGPATITKSRYRGDIIIRVYSTLRPILSESCYSTAFTL